VLKPQACRAAPAGAKAKDACAVQHLRVPKQDACAAQHLQVHAVVVRRFPAAGKDT